MASPGQLHATIGWTVTLSCLVWADPPARVSWFRGEEGRELLETQDHPAEEVSRRIPLVQFERKYISALCCIVPACRQYSD